MSELFLQRRVVSFLQRRADDGIHPLLSCLFLCILRTKCFGPGITCKSNDVVKRCIVLFKHFEASRTQSHVYSRNSRRESGLRVKLIQRKGHVSLLVRCEAKETYSHVGNNCDRTVSFSRMWLVLQEGASPKRSIIIDIFQVPLKCTKLRIPSGRILC